MDETRGTYHCSFCEWETVGTWDEVDVAMQDHEKEKHGDRLAALETATETFTTALRGVGSIDYILSRIYRLVKALADQQDYPPFRENLEYLLRILELHAMNELSLELYEKAVGRITGAVRDSLDREIRGTENKN